MSQTDFEIGTRLRTFRKALGISQKELADRVGVRFQQIQKYENGSNRIAASRLSQIADALGLPVMSLFRESHIQEQMTTETSELIDLYLSLPGPIRSEFLFQMRAATLRYGVPGKIQARELTRDNA